MAPDDQRASPEALLALAEREGRGRLKIFLGSFPGAGKTYAMLQAAQAARAEGLDVVQRITRVRVRETIPDSVFEKADDVVLVDITPDELLKRLAEGKVYIQDTATRAVENFFRPGNLMALRELTLRRAAERIDADLVERMQGSAIEGPWAAGERILVCVGADPASQTVVRHAKRLADLMGAPWIAVSVERPDRPVPAKDRRKIQSALRLADSLGAETQTLVGHDITRELLH